MKTIIEEEAYQIWLKTPMTEVATMQGGMERNLILRNIEWGLKELYKLAEKYGYEVKKK